MVYEVHKPSKVLAGYINEMVYIKDYHPEHNLDKYLPDGTFNIVFELSGVTKQIFDNVSKNPIQECKDVWFSGVHKHYITISAHAEEMLVVVFKAGSGFPLLQKPVNTFTNEVFAAENIFGNSIVQLHDSLKTISNSQQKFATIEKWLLSRLKEDDFYNEVIRFALEEIHIAPSEIEIKALAKKSGYSQKQFIQLFKKYVGITPKQYHRIVRFNEILKAIENKESMSWTKIANDCGYFDQAHFIKDFQAFSGLNPKAYLSDIGDYPNYFPVK